MLTQLWTWSFNTSVRYIYIHIQNCGLPMASLCNHFISVRRNALRIAIFNSTSQKPSELYFKDLNKKFEQDGKVTNKTKHENKTIYKETGFLKRGRPTINTHYRFFLVPLVTLNIKELVEKYKHFHITSQTSITGSKKFHIPLFHLSSRTWIINRFKFVIHILGK
jgi:hypothetical protein